MDTKKTVKLAGEAQKAFGRRIVAGLIDLTLWFVLFIVAAVNFGKVTTVTQNSTTNTHATLTGLPLLIFLLIQLAYFVILEWQLGGTVGKLLTGVRVVGVNGQHITLRQSFIRNLLRIVDAFPYFIPYLTGLVLIAGGKHKQRLGDRVANTLIVPKG
jgi:uncharacterized RDD family membrane protein YckC